MLKCSGEDLHLIVLGLLINSSLLLSFPKSANLNFTILIHFDDNLMVFLIVSTHTYYINWPLLSRWSDIFNIFKVISILEYTAHQTFSGSPQ